MKIILRLLLIIAVLFLAARWILPGQIEKRLPALLENYGLNEVSLSIRSIGFTGIQIRRMKFTYDNASLQSSFIVRDAAIDINWLEMSPDSIFIDKVYVKYTQKVDDTQQTTEKIELPILPFEILRIKRADVKASLLTGHIHFRGGVDIANIDGASVRVWLIEKKQNLILKATHRLDDLSLVLRNEDTTFLTLSATADLPVIKTAKLDTNLQKLYEWFKDTTLIPIEHRSILNDIKFNHGNLKLQYELEKEKEHHFYGSVDVDKLQYDLLNLSAKTSFDANLSGKSLDITLQNKPRFNGNWAEHVFNADLSPDYKLKVNDISEPDKNIAALGVVNLSYQNRGKVDSFATVKNWSLGSKILKGKKLRTLSLNVKELRDISMPFDVPSVSLMSKIYQRGDYISSTGNVLLGKRKFGTYKLRLNTETQKGYVNLDVNYDAEKVLNLIRSFKPEPLKSISINQGNIKLQGRVNLPLKKTIKGNMKLIAENISGKYEEVVLNQVNVSANIAELLPLVFSSKLIIDQVKFANDLTLDSGSIELDWQKDHLVLNKAKVDMLGGKVQVPAGSVLQQDGITSGQLHASNVNLEKLFKLLNQPGLSGTGDMSGTLPVFVEGKSFEILNAKFKNNGSGILKYKNAGLDKASNIALQALDNFHYEHLEATIDYTRNGDYKIKLLMEGKNPDLYDGHPVKFNLNINGNLPGLIQSSLIRGDFGQAVMEEVERQEKNNR